MRNYKFARFARICRSRKFDKITNRIESFVPRSLFLVIFGGHLFRFPSERISLEDKVRAFDKEVDNRGIKIISQGQADDG